MDTTATVNEYPAARVRQTPNCSNFFEAGPLQANGSGHWRQLRHTQRQPLDAMAREVDLGPGVVAGAFQGLYRAFAKFGVKNLHAGAQTMRRSRFLNRHRGRREFGIIYIKLSSSPRVSLACSS